MTSSIPSSPMFNFAFFVARGTEWNMVEARRGTFRFARWIFRRFLPVAMSSTLLKLTASSDGLKLHASSDVPGKLTAGCCPQCSATQQHRLKHAVALLHETGSNAQQLIPFHQPSYHTSGASYTHTNQPDTNPYHQPPRRINEHQLVHSVLTQPPAGRYAAAAAGLRLPTTSCPSPPSPSPSPAPLSPASGFDSVRL